MKRTPRYARLGFVALVTATLLAFVIEQATTGGAGVPAMLVYAFAAGFGLEFVSAVWTGRDRRNPPARFARF